MYKYFLLLLFSITVNAQSVYKTPTGKKYHTSSCRMVENVSEKITLSEASELGLGPCKICNPKSNSNITGFVSSVNSPQGTDETVQCKGQTKKGTRCKHRTKIANGYCFQHNPDK